MPDKIRDPGRSASNHSAAGHSCPACAHMLYVPDPRIMAQLGPALKGKSIVIFTGQFCSDCNEGMPKIRAIIEGIRPRPDVKLFELERGGISPPEMRQLSIVAIPTLIVLSGKKELGRIVERPAGSWEEHLLNICVG